METLTKDITLGFYNETGILTVPISQNDVGRIIAISFTNDGSKFDIPDNTTVFLKAQKPDGTQINTDECCSIADNMVRIKVFKQLSAVEGIVKCELVLGDPNGEIYTSNHFNVAVTKSVHDDENLRSTDTYKNIVEILFEMESLRKDLVFKSDKDQANGVPSLDENTKIPRNELYDAGLTEKGVVKLVDSVKSDSTTDAATPNSVKIVNDNLQTHMNEQQHALNLKADIESPTFTGIPQAPTPDDNTNSTQIATTAYVKSNIANKVDKVEGKGLSTNDYTNEEKAKLNNLDLVSIEADGLVPKLPDYADSNKFLMGNGLWTSLPSNGKTSDGTVKATYGVANKVWKTDENGNPGWRYEQDIPIPVIPGALSEFNNDVGFLTEATANKLYGTKTEIDDLKKFVSDGKTLVAAAITEKGIITAADATFATMATHISNISKSTDTSDATAKAENILAGFTSYGKNGKITGSMPNNGSISESLSVNGTYMIPKGYHDGTGKITQTITTKPAATYTPSTQDQSISAGQYLSGAQTIKGDGNLIAANIIKGKTIFNVVGTAAPKLQSKSVTPTDHVLTITSDAGFDGLYAVSIGAIPSADFSKLLHVSTKTNSQTDSSLLIDIWNGELTSKGYSCGALSKSPLNTGFFVIDYNVTKSLYYTMKFLKKCTTSLGVFNINDLHQWKYSEKRNIYIISKN